MSSSSQYTYHPASSQSTRQILDPTSPSRSHPTNPSDYPSSPLTSPPSITSTSTSNTNTNTNVPFRPGQPIRSSSSNYANAASLVRAKEREEVEVANANAQAQATSSHGTRSSGNDYFSTSSTSTSAAGGAGAGAGTGSAERKESTGGTGGVAGWKPSFTRKMSWDPQELKREMHVRQFSGAAGLQPEGGGLAGFSEK